MAGEDIHTIWRIWGDGGLIDKLGPDRAIRELKKRCDAGAIIGCSLYKLLIEKWIDVATGAKDPGQRGPAEDFMSSAGEEELVKKIEDLHVQYPNGIPRSIRMDVKDEWNAELERKVGRRIPLDPKDASKKDIADSKKIAEQLAAGVGLPRLLKPKVGIEELPLPPPVKPVERAPPRAAPPEVVPTPIITRALPEFELMKKEIEERIQEEKRRRLKRGPMAGEPAATYYISDRELDMVAEKISKLSREERVKIARGIIATMSLPDEPENKNEIVESVYKKVIEIEKEKGEIRYISLDDIAKLPMETRRALARKIASGEIEFIRESQDVGMYSVWTYEDFETVINLTKYPEDLAHLDRLIDESTVTTPSEKSGLRQLIARREAEIRRGGIREDDIKKDDDVMQVPGDYAEWEFGDFEGQIPGLDDPEDLEILLEYTDVSDKLAKDESKTIREMIKERIRKVEKAGS